MKLRPSTQLLQDDATHSGQPMGWDGSSWGAVDVLSLICPSAASIPFTVQAAVAQTASVTEWHNSAGGVLAAVIGSGEIRGFKGLASFGASAATGLALYVQGDTAGNVLSAFRGATSQTSNLMEWQDPAGNLLAAVIAAGEVRCYKGVGSFGASGSTGLALYVQGDTAGNVLAAFRGAASQTSPLTEWQNSAGTALATVDAAGAGTFAGLSITDAKDVVFGTTTGTKIGTGTTQKIGFWNTAPATQPAAVADATDAASVITQLNALLARLRTIGLIAT